MILRIAETAYQQLHETLEVSFGDFTTTHPRG